MKKYQYSDDLLLFLIEGAESMVDMNERISLVNR